MHRPPMRLRPACLPGAADEDFQRAIGPGLHRLKYNLFRCTAADRGGRARRNPIDRSNRFRYCGDLDLKSGRRYKRNLDGELLTRLNYDPAIVWSEYSHASLSCLT